MPRTTTPARKRDPELTRSVILDAAQRCLAKDGAEGVSVSAVAKLAGVNRGTAYQHFNSKDALIRATLERVSQQLLEASFSPDERPDQLEPGDLDPALVNTPDIVRGLVHFNVKLAEFTIENPDISRIWLFDVLSRKNPREDIFYQHFEESLRLFAASDACEPGIDIEAHAVMLLSGFFMWPIWVGGQARTKKERTEKARRYAGEVIRLSLHGVIRTDGRAEFEKLMVHI